MLISVLYVGSDTPQDWIPVDSRARMAVLTFEEFIQFIQSARGKIYAQPEVEEFDPVAWERFCSTQCLPESSTKLKIRGILTANKYCGGK